MLALCCLCLPTLALAATVAPVAVFPLQELGGSRNEINLSLTRLLIERLSASGNEVSDYDTVVAFMAHNRIRHAGTLETYNLSRVRDDLGAAFVLLGTVSQRKEQPQLALGLTLQLVRTSDARTIWSYTGHAGAGDTRRLMGVGEPRTVADLQELLFAEILRHWPWEMVREIQQAGVISIDTIRLEPDVVRPGGEVFARVRLRNVWLPGRAPRVFFKADDQLYAARASADGTTYEANWVAGQKDGRFPVTLIFEWPLYGRKESALLGTYTVDGTLPLFEIELRGTQLYQGMPTFRRELVIIPQLLVRKPLQRWRLAFHDAASALLGADEGEGNLPERFIWQGLKADGELVDDGVYRVVVEVWDRAGNQAKASREVARSASVPEVELSAARSGRDLVLDLEQSGKVPLAFWRLDMWTRDGKLLTEREGRELPARIDVELPTGDPDAQVEGLLVVQDAFGNRVRHKLQDLLRTTAPPAAAEVKEVTPAGISETWVDEF
jgi:TolB-like protein